MSVDCNEMQHLPFFLLQAGFQTSPASRRRRCRCPSLGLSHPSFDTLVAFDPFLALLWDRSNYASPSTSLPRRVPTKTFEGAQPYPDATYRTLAAKPSVRRLDGTFRELSARRARRIEAGNMDESIVSKSNFFAVDYEGYSPNFCVRRPGPTPPSAFLDPVWTSTARFESWRTFDVVGS